ncbi:hypothetical protein QT971_06985 [Microcoleus sp. herbarium19]
MSGIETGFSFRWLHRGWRRLENWRLAQGADRDRPLMFEPRRSGRSRSLKILL